MAVYWRGSFRPAQPHSRPSTAAGENAPRQDIPLDWVRGVERLHGLSQLRAAVETTGTVSAIAAKKNRPTAQLILGSGQMGNVHLSPEAEAYFAKKSCEVLLQPTPEAIHVFNRSHAKKIGLFHVTC